MQVHVTSRKPIFDDRLGRLKAGDVVDLPEQKALFYIQRGEAVAYQTKVLQDRPSLGSGTQLSASPAAPVSQQTTASESEYGVKKTARKKKEAS